MLEFIFFTSSFAEPILYFELPPMSFRNYVVRIWSDSVNSMLRLATSMANTKKKHLGRFEIWTIKLCHDFFNVGRDHPANVSYAIIPYSSSKAPPKFIYIFYTLHVRSCNCLTLSNITLVTYKYSRST